MLYIFYGENYRIICSLEELRSERRKTCGVHDATRITLVRARRTSSQTNRPSAVARQVSAVPAGAGEGTRDTTTPTCRGARATSLATSAAISTVEQLAEQQRRGYRR